MVKYAITTVIFKVPKKFGTPTPHPPTFGTVPQIKSSFSLGAWFIDLKLLERRRISIMKKQPFLFFPFRRGALQTDEMKILAPVVLWTVNHPHLHFNGSSFKFWEISNNPGTFSEFLPRSDAKTRRRISPSRKMICTVLCIRCQGKSLPSFEDANGIEFFTRLWQEAELNWQSKLMLCWSNTHKPCRHMKRT